MPKIFRSLSVLKGIWSKASTKKKQGEWGYYKADKLYRFDKDW